MGDGQAKRGKGFTPSSKTPSLRLVMAVFFFCLFEFNLHSEPVIRIERGENANPYKSMT
jgi:hypothetical protein